MSIVKVKRSLLAIFLAPVVLGATMTGSATASRAHQPIAIRATLQGRALLVTGSNFDPGARVAIALINTRTWRALFKGSAVTEAATYQCPKGISVMCGLRDPNAGELYFETTLGRPTSAPVLAVLYRSGAEIGLGRVHRQ